jgi:hypothetical protein
MKAASAQETPEPHGIPICFFEKKKGKGLAFESLNYEVNSKKKSAHLDDG